jgi:hypothetical protein
VLVDLGERTVRWLALVDGRYRPVAASRLIDLRSAALSEAINWPSDPDVEPSASHGGKVPPLH